MGKTENTNNNDKYKDNSIIKNNNFKNTNERKIKASPRPEIPAFLRAKRGKKNREMQSRASPPAAADVLRWQIIAPGRGLRQEHLKFL